MMDKADTQIFHLTKLLMSFLTVQFWCCIAIVYFDVLATRCCDSAHDREVGSARSVAARPTSSTDWRSRCRRCCCCHSRRYRITPGRRQPLRLPAIVDLSRYDGQLDHRVIRVTTVCRNCSQIGVTVKKYSCNNIEIHGRRTRQCRLPRCG